MSSQVIPKLSSLAGCQIPLESLQPHLGESVQFSKQAKKALTAFRNCFHPSWNFEQDGKETYAQFYAEEVLEPLTLLVNRVPKLVESVFFEVNREGVQVEHPYAFTPYADMDLTGMNKPVIFTLNGSHPPKAFTLRSYQPYKTFPFRIFDRDCLERYISPLDNIDRAEFIHYACYLRIRPLMEAFFDCQDLEDSLLEHLVHEALYYEHYDFVIWVLNSSYSSKIPINGLNSWASILVFAACEGSQQVVRAIMHSPFFAQINKNGIGISSAIQAAQDYKHFEIAEEIKARYQEISSSNL